MQFYGLIVGKDKSKENRDKSLWYNAIDHYTQNTTNGETHGLWIVPHTSNLLSEIILVNIDEVLYKKGWKYIRNVDDYSCYASSYEDAQKFLVDLNKQLRYFSLNLNHKKTSILELPLATVEQWVRQINSYISENQPEFMKYTKVKSYLDSAIEIMPNNNPF